MKKKQIDEILMGKLPPQAIEMEQIIISSCLNYEKAVAFVTQLLKPECFYNLNNQVIMKAIFDLIIKRSNVDILTVIEQLKVNKEYNDDIRSYVLATSDIIATMSVVENHCYIVLEKYLSRTLIKMSVEAADSAYRSDTDIINLIDSFTLELMNLRSRTLKKKPTHISQVAQENMKEIVKRSSKDYKPLGIMSGIKELDEITLGFQPELYFIGARPGMGKSSFVCTLLNNISIEQKIPSVLFSLEMNKDSIELRLKTIRTGISYGRFTTGDIDNGQWANLNEQTDIISSSPIYIDDSSGTNIIDLRSKIINICAKENIRIVFVDFIQRMSSSERGNKDPRIIINEISGGLADIAKDLKIPIVALSQLSRVVELSKDKIPELQHLKESGNLEQDAYCVIFLYRPEYYGFDYFSDKNAHIESKDRAQIFVAKHRNGTLGAPIINFNKSTMAFSSFYNNFIQKETKVKGVDDDF